MTLFRSHDKRTVDLKAGVIAAGSSAALLSLSHLWPELWFVTLFALVPFLWRLCNVNLRGAILLGMMLATGFVCATSVTDAALSPMSFLVRLLAFNVVFIVFGIGVNRTKKYIGLDPLIIASLWCPLEYALIRYTGLGTPFSLSEGVPGFVAGFCSLFGLLIGSLVIFLGNSLILLLAERLKTWTHTLREFLAASERKVYTVSHQIISERNWSPLCHGRAPPLHYVR
ncbi:MAG TPA: hypothetical protein VN285_09520 [Candidatus Deferrimicrobium sp.]|nr:hypothetical protein [Candidatus Deferrimicrobium sp.]